MTRTAPPPFLLLDPWLRDLVWGGHALHARYGLGLPDDAIAEAWVLADRPEGRARVAWPAGVGTLGDALDAWGPAVLGARGATSAGRLPVLVKLLDAAQTLSVQVHPGRQHLGDPRLPGAESKEECWLVLGAKAGSKLYLGVQPGVDEAAFRRALAAGSVEDLLGVHEARVGDVIHVRPGTLHAIGAGLLLAEVQESSDTTYRVWDWGRTGTDDRPRDLHLEQALAVTDWSRRAADCIVRPDEESLPRANRGLIETAAFGMDWCHAPACLKGEADAWVAYLLLEGPAVYVVARDDVPMCHPGQVVLLPAGADPVPVVPGGPRGWLRVNVPRS